VTGIFAAAWVIARRDFVATVWSRFFILFLIAPVVVIAFSGLIGGVTGAEDARASRPRIAIVTDTESARAIEAAHARLSKAIGGTELPAIELIDPAEDSRAQANYLIADKQRNISAVLTGTLARPALNAPPRTLDSLGGEIGLIIGDARRAGTLRGAGFDDAEVVLARVETGQSVGGLVMVRHLLARGGQFVIFFLTMLLATTLVTNLVEEKSNKVIEVLAAAVPLDAVFLGKLLAMLGVSIIGILVWGGIAGIALVFVKDLIGFPIVPAVGWPAYCVLLLLYFTTNFMLLGALFLGIGGQANSMREIQTLSLPITFGQILVFLLASATVGGESGAMTWAAILFPFSAPLTMMGLAAQSDDLWIHLLALAWQILWVVLTIRISARLFRLTILKSETRQPFFEFLGRRKAAPPMAAPMVAPAAGEPDSA